MPLNRQRSRKSPSQGHSSFLSRKEQLKIQIDFGEPLPRALHPMRPEWLGRPPSQVALVFFDLETTGGNPQNAAVTELAAIRFEAGVETGRFHTLVNPRRHIPRRVQEITGISPELVRDAPTMDAIIEDFLDFVGDGVLVSHGVLSDFAFIAHAADKYLSREFKNYYICTHLLVSNFFSELPNKSLSGIAAHFEAEPAKAHRADADAQMTADVFWKMFQVLEANGFHTIEDLLKLQADQNTIRRLGSGILAQEIEEKAPSSPGIYYLFNAHREIAFLSSAANLRRDLQDTIRFGEEREFNKLLVDCRDFKFERTPHFLAALMKEKDQLERLNLPVDPRRVQPRSDGFVQLFVSQDILDLAKQRPDAVAFPIHVDNWDSLTAQRLRESANKEVTVPTVAYRNEAEKLIDTFLADSDESVPVRSTHRLKTIKRLDKLRVRRRVDDALITYGPLQEGLGWYFGPFDSPKDVYNRLKDAVGRMGIDNPTLSPIERSRRLLLLVRAMKGLPTGDVALFESLPSRLLRGLMQSVLGLPNSPGLVVESIIKEKGLAFDRRHQPRTGVAVISNPELKELEFYVAVNGTVRRMLRLPPEENDKLTSARYFTRLFAPYHREIAAPEAPCLFTAEVCADVELFAHWLNRRNSEGEWADFAELSGLYQPME